MSSPVVLKTFPGQEGTPIAISSDGQRVLVLTQFSIEGVDLNGNRLFEIPAARSSSPVVIVADDVSGILVVRHHRDPQLQWYRLN